MFLVTSNLRIFTNIVLYHFYSHFDPDVACYEGKRGITECPINTEYNY